MVIRGVLDVGAEPDWGPGRASLAVQASQKSGADDRAVAGIAAPRAAG